MATLIKSQLNPLADAFIPTSSLNVLRNRRVTELIETENESKTWQRIGKQDSNNRDYDYKISKEIAARLHNYKDLVSKDTFFFGRITSISMGFKDCFVDQKSCTFGNFNLRKLESSTDYLGRVQRSNVDKLCMLQNSNLSVLECLKDDNQGVVQESGTNTAAAPKINEILSGKEENECTCPPMFGWVVPPDFIGNPFNLKYECRKKYPHSPNSDINGWTLDQCYSEMQDIVTDVIDAITVDCDPIAKWDEEYKIQDYLEVSDTEMEEAESDEMKSKNTESFGLPPTSKVVELELVDDGVHPLLQSAPANDEDERNLVEKVEKILEKSLSPLPKSEFPTSEPRAIGDPCSQDPCSQWCECLPMSVKETFRKYIQKSRDAKNFKVCHTGHSFVQRPVFKRSFSADDAHMYGQFGETSIDDSRDMILLRRRDPLKYFKISSNSLIKGRKHGSCDLTDQQLYTNSKVKSSMWGKFDGVDSLWQPLPECMPLNAINQKPNIYKKGRETRRQRTS